MATNEPLDWATAGPGKLLQEGLNRINEAEKLHEIQVWGEPGQVGVRVRRPDGRSRELDFAGAAEEKKFLLEMGHAYLTAALAASNILLAYPLEDVASEQGDSMEQSDGSLGDH